MVAIEKGIDSHARLFAESQFYSTTQGFLAYYAPYIRNDAGVFTQPTPYVAGLAIRRYRDEAGGFKLPPAGAKYSLAGARGCEIAITSAQQEVSTPQGLNALRQLPGYSSTDPDTGETYGPVFVWGSRTRVNRGNSEQALYQFVNTRVILNVIFGTLRSAFDGQIFDVIDGRAVTFNQIRAIAYNTLYESFYVPGALFGSTPAEAFEVVVDERNNPPGALENGFINVKVFVVPVPTLERIEVDLIRVGIGGIQDALQASGIF
jgi:phage tail sheath protein FI